MRRITTWAALTLVLLTTAVVGQEAGEDIIEMHGVDKIDTLLGFVAEITGKNIVRVEHLLLSIKKQECMRTPLMRFKSRYGKKIRTIVMPGKC